MCVSNCEVFLHCALLSVPGDTWGRWNMMAVMCLLVFESMLGTLMSCLNNRFNDIKGPDLRSDMFAADVWQQWKGSQCISRSIARTFRKWKLAFAQTQKICKTLVAGPDIKRTGWHLFRSQPLKRHARRFTRGVDDRVAADPYCRFDRHGTGKTGLTCAIQRKTSRSLKLVFSHVSATNTNIHTNCLLF